MQKPPFEKKYDFVVEGTLVRVFRMDKLLPIKFSTADKGTKDSESPLHRFLEGVGWSSGDARVVCEAVEKGDSVRSVFGRY